MAGLAAPLTENDLLAHLPPNNVAGALSRDILPPGERVLYETRPGLFALFGGRLVFIVLWSALWLYFALTVNDPIGAGILLFPTTLWLLVLLLQWRHRVYALTDQRVIRLSGMRGQEFQDAAYSQIHNLGTDSSGLRFDTTPPPTIAGQRTSSRGHVIRWESISDVPRVYTFVQEAFAFGLTQSRDRAMLQAAVARVADTSIRCAYCGGLIDLATMDPQNPRCPSCRAPVVLPT